MRRASPHGAPVSPLKLAVASTWKRFRAMRVLTAHLYLPLNVACCVDVETFPGVENVSPSRPSRKAFPRRRMWRLVSVSARLSVSRRKALDVETFLRSMKTFRRRHPLKTFPRQTFPRGRTGKTFPVSTSRVRVRGNVLSPANDFEGLDVETFLHGETF